MAAAIKFYGNALYDAGSSGVGFYGSSGFGSTVGVSAWQGRTFICSPNGATQGP